MKIFSGILKAVTSFLLTVLGAAFVFIEGYLLFTGDFLLFEVQAIAFLQMLLRLCLALMAMVLGIFGLIKRGRSQLFESIVLLAVTIVIAPFLTNGFGMYFILFALLLVIANTLYKRFTEVK